MEDYESKTIRRQGGSLSVSLTQQFQEMGLVEGDQVFVLKTPQGIEITRYDPEFVRAIKSARKAMKRFPNALRELAK